MRSRANIKFPEIYEDNNEFGIENGYWQLKGKHREITIGRWGGGVLAESELRQVAQEKIPL